MGPAPSVPTPSSSSRGPRHSTRSHFSTGGSHSSGYSRPAPAARPFSLSSAVFLVSDAGRRRWELDSDLALQLRRHWRMSPRPDQVLLPDGSVVEHFQSLECGSAILRSRDGSQKCKLEVKVDVNIAPGSLTLPDDLESEDQRVNLSSVGKFLSEQEQSQLKDQSNECIICSENVVSKSVAKASHVPSWAAPSAPSFQAHRIDEDGDVVMDNPSNPVSSHPAVEGPVFQLQCGHVYHTDCLKKWFEQRASCPVCLKKFGKVVGTQPRTGTFQWQRDPNIQLQGNINATGAIVIQFKFPPGKDDDGRPYPGRTEDGYLPCNCQGIIQLELFKVAFRRRVMFGLGTSMATGRFKPTFNIHIKTKPGGGAPRHGYPDPDYFRRSLDELKNAGVSVADLPP